MPLNREFVKEQLKKRDWTIANLTKEMIKASPSGSKFNPSTVYQWFQRGNQPTMDNLSLLAKVLGCDLNDLHIDSEDPLANTVKTSELETTKEEGEHGKD